ncbi:MULTISPECIES: peroxidase-related enzyme [unclassified Iodidimonas]|jgi:uncharacterized peroxidase-related enzyme|uniref:carboxymuconolactone decarboxylase family protein n=1 Tax=unclassified Iodidimonas TaxID=2626145 RepID=UPI002482535B|nr:MULTISPECIES: peroxidase-related enzyme [unclassified Iodidimonas]
MPWIKTIAPVDASGDLVSIYESVADHGRVDGILIAQSLKPETIKGHVALYRAIFDERTSHLPLWMLQMVGVYTSLVNGCPYCIEQSFGDLCLALHNDCQARDIRAALEAGLPQTALEGKALAAAHYAEKLARSPRAMKRSDVEALRDAGFEDAEILEINQAVAYFSYANRTILGLGLSDDDLSPTPLPQSAAAGLRDAPV